MPLSTECLGELTRGSMSINCSPEMLTSWFQKIFLLTFYESMRANHIQVTIVVVAKLNPRVIDCKGSAGLT